MVNGMLLCGEDAWVSIHPWKALSAGAGSPTRVGPASHAPNRGCRVPPAFGKLTAMPDTTCRAGSHPPVCRVCLLLAHARRKLVWNRYSGTACGDEHDRGRRCLAFCAATIYPLPLSLNRRTLYTVHARTAATPSRQQDMIRNKPNLL